MIVNDKVKRKKRGRFITATICLSLVMIFFSLPLTCMATAGDNTAGLTGREPIRIAAIFSLTGMAARHNKQLLDVILTTVEKVNTEGGVLGRPLEVVVIDNKSSSIGSLEAAKKAIREKVTAVIGAHWSSHSLAIAPSLQNAGIPMISPASTNPDVTLGRSYVFRICFIDTMQGRAMARFAIEHLHIRSVAILYNIDERYSTDLASYFQTEILLRNRKVTSMEGYRGEATDFSRIIKGLLEDQPDAVYIPGYTRDTALFMKQARKNGLKSVFLGGDGWDLIEKLIDKEVEGSYQTVLWHPDLPFAETDAAIDIMRQANENEAWNLSSPMGYDAVMVLVDAIKRAGTTERDQIRDALAHTRNFPGVAGPLTFDSQGDPMDKGIAIVKFEQGEMKYVTMIKP